ncbi:MAG: PspC domain-containing protein [Methanocalculus sp. MSAO_Arc2]|uniref:PspC domain-containing protein n=1 Tax=Methanocalculus sp. MSAO_Arc2 TaxID=2293855 RepID=UPI000FF2CAE0|nr:MAG: PspC domain-containing protein [Methanocalculus sp. MSAO_Arc2]
MAQEKRLTRSRRYRLLGGVCGGVAEYFGWDPSLVRIGWVILSLLPAFPGIIAYIIAWIIIPDDEDGTKRDNGVYSGE